MLMPVTIPEVLVQYAQNCPELEGAVVASRDGLVLGATERFAGDAPAAAAASLWVHLEQDLALIQQSVVNESLLWTETGVWYLCRLQYDHLLLAHSRSAGSAGAMRLAGQIAAQQLARMLSKVG